MIVSPRLGVGVSNQITEGSPQRVGKSRETNRLCGCRYNEASNVVCEQTRQDLVKGSANSSFSLNHRGET